MADRSNHVTRGMILGWVYVCIVAISAESVFRPGLKTCNVYSKPHRAGVCGKHIDEALKLICGPGNFGERSKRSLLDQNIQEMPVADFLALSKQNAQIANTQDGEEFDDILLQRSVATNFLTKRIPFKQSGVSCECCYHSCNVLEMAGYCKDRSKARI